MDDSVSEGKVDNGRNQISTVRQSQEDRLLRSGADKVFEKIADWDYCQPKIRLARLTP